MGFWRLALCGWKWQEGSSRGSWWIHEKIKALWHSPGVWWRLTGKFLSETSDIWNVSLCLQQSGMLECFLNLWILQMNSASPNIPKRDPAKEYPLFGELRLQKSSFPTRIQKFKAAGWHDALLAASPVGPLMNGEWCPPAMLVGWETFLKPISLYDLWIYGYMMIS